AGDRAGHRSVVILRLVALEAELALAVRPEAAAQLELAAGLQVVDAVGLRLPDVERRIRQGLAVDRCHAAGDPYVLALHGRAFAQVGAIAVLLGAVGEERTEDGRF